MGQEQGSPELKVLRILITMEQGLEKFCPFLGAVSPHLLPWLFLSGVLPSNWVTVSKVPLNPGSSSCQDPARDP